MKPSFFERFSYFEELKSFIEKEGYSLKAHSKILFINEFIGVTVHALNRIIYALNTAPYLTFIVGKKFQK